MQCLLYKGFDSGEDLFVLFSWSKNCLKKNDPISSHFVLCGWSEKLIGQKLPLSVETI
jgi:hypothetical protein